MENIRENIIDKIIDWVAIGSEGRLIAVKNEKGGDLVVQRKGGYGEGELLFKIEIFIRPSNQENFVKDVEFFNPEKNLYILFVIFDEIKQKVEEKFWLVPSTEKITKFESLKFDKYLINRKDFDIFLIRKLISEKKKNK